MLNNNNIDQAGFEMRPTEAPKKKENHEWIIAYNCSSSEGSNQ